MGATESLPSPVEGSHVGSSSTHGQSLLRRGPSFHPRCLTAFWGGQTITGSRGCSWQPLAGWILCLKSHSYTMRTHRLVLMAILLQSYSRGRLGPCTDDRQPDDRQ